MQILIIRPFSFDSLKKIINFEADKEAISYEWRVMSDE